MVASFLEVHAVASVAFNRICHGTPFLVQGDAFMVNSHAYLNINQALVNWIILIHHFAKSHRVPGISSPVQVDGIDRPFSSRTFAQS